MARDATSRTRGAAAALIAAFLLGGCTVAGGAGPYGDTDPDVLAAIDRDVTPMGFTICHGYGCLARSAAALSPAEWRTILRLFGPESPDASIERARIAQAVALFERAVGPRTGTANDAPGAPFNLADFGQLDCVDESINTSVYLTMLHRAGLLRWHEPADPARRGHFYTWNIHFTATLRERRTGDYYAVDSWFLANGEPAVVIPLATWRDGWRPGDPVTATASR